MTRLTDGKKTVEIKMRDKDGVDWEGDFFEVGGLKYDDEKDAYIVADVDYCVEQATDCHNCEGDYYDTDRPIRCDFCGNYAPEGVCPECGREIKAGAEFDLFICYVD